MKEKYTPKTKRSLKSRFKKDNRQQSQTTEEKEIDKEQLQELLKQTASQEEDRLEDLIFITKKQTPTVLPTTALKQEQLEKDQTKACRSPLDLDQSLQEENKEEFLFDVRGSSPLDPKDLNALNNPTQKIHFNKQQDLDSSLFDSGRQSFPQNINIEREGDPKQNQPVPSDLAWHSTNLAMPKDQPLQQGEQQLDPEQDVGKQESRFDKTIDDPALPQQEEQDLKIDPEQRIDLQASNNLESKLEQERLSDQNDHFYSMLQEENLTNRASKQDEQSSEHSSPLPQKDIEETSSCLKTRNQTKDEHDLRDDSSTSTAHSHTRKNKLGKNSLKHKITHALHQWQTYFVLGAIFSIFFLLFKIYTLHFFKLSFAGMVLGLGMAAILIAIFGFYYVPKKIGNIGAILICVLIATQSLGLQNEMNLISNSIAQMSHTEQNAGRKMGIYVPTQIPLSSLEALDGETIGIMAQRDDEGIHAVLTSLAEQDIHVQTKSYSSLQQLYKGAKGLAVRAVILNEADVSFIDDFAPSTNPTSPLTKVYSMTLPSTTPSMTQTDRTNMDLEVEPYTILISGSNDPLDQSAYRSNFNLLVTIHPQTKQVLTTLIPRTLALATSCQEQNACPQGITEERLSFVSYNSIEALKQSIEETLEIPIDFTVRIDLTKLLELFDLDSTLRYQQATEVDSYIDIQQGQGEPYNIYQMKQLIGNVQDLAPDDLNQELTILRVLKTIMQAQELPHTKDIAPVLELLKQAISTSFTPNQFSQIIKTFFIFPMKMEEYYTCLQSETTTQYSPTLTETLYMSKVDRNSLDTIKQAIDAIQNASKNNPAQINVAPLPTPSSLELAKQNETQNQEEQTVSNSTEAASENNSSTQLDEPQQEVSAPVEQIDQDLQVEPIESEDSLPPVEPTETRE